MAKPVERIAVLETKMSAVESSLASLHSKLDTVLTQQSKYKGFWGAVTLITTALWAALTYLWPRH